jgi:hypothetical protein
MHFDNPHLRFSQGKAEDLLVRQLKTSPIADTIGSYLAMAGSLETVVQNLEAITEAARRSTSTHHAELICFTLFRRLGLGDEAGETVESVREKYPRASAVEHICLLAKSFRVNDRDGFLFLDRLVKEGKKQGSKWASLRSLLSHGKLREGELQRTRYYLRRNMPAFWAVAELKPELIEYRDLRAAFQHMPEDDWKYLFGELDDGAVECSAEELEQIIADVLQRHDLSPSVAIEIVRDLSDEFICHNVKVFCRICEKVLDDGDVSTAVRIAKYIESTLPVFDPPLPVVDKENAATVSAFCQRLRRESGAAHRPKDAE